MLEGWERKSDSHRIPLLNKYVLSKDQSHSFFRESYKTCELEDAIRMLKLKRGANNNYCCSITKTK